MPSLVTLDADVEVDVSQGIERGSQPQPEEIESRQAERASLAHPVCLQSDDEFLRVLVSETPTSWA